MSREIDEYTELWQTQDAITTVVNACGYGVWDLHLAGCGFKLELDCHLTEEAVCDLCCQLPLSADYGGEGAHGSVIILYSRS